MNTFGEDFKNALKLVTLGLLAVAGGFGVVFGIGNIIIGVTLGVAYVLGGVISIIVGVLLFTFAITVIIREYL